MANLQAEGNFSPLNAEDDKTDRNGNYYSVGQRHDTGYISNYNIHDGVGWGLAQWTFYSRKQALYDYAASVGLSIGDMDAQLGYLRKEMTTDYYSMWQRIKESTDLSYITERVYDEFEHVYDSAEQPRQYHRAQLAIRIGYADSIYSSLH
jgi:hypothetical protein